MKYRSGFVSNSSTSSFIIIPPKEAVQKKRIKSEWMQDLIFHSDAISDFCDTPVECKDLAKEAADTIQQASVPLIDPRRKDDFKQHYDETDRDIFLKGAGFSTFEQRGNRSKFTTYKQLWNQLQNEQRDGFYVVVGQDSDLGNDNSRIATILEDVFADLAKKKPNEIKTLAWRP